MKKEACLFELTYLKKEEEPTVWDTSVANKRMELGRLLARRYPVKGDGFIVVPVPETAIYFAQGYSLEAKIPLVHAVFKKRPKPKTLYVDEREKIIKDVFSVVPELVKDKKIILIDEAIISGSTLTEVIEKLKESGAKEIHARVVAPMCRKCVRGYSRDFWKYIQNGTDYAEYFKIDSFKSFDINFLKDLADCVHCFERNQR